MFFCRGFYWANYATGLGASLHELAHTFDLPHTPTGIMARGFDDIYKVFTLRKSRTKDKSRSHRSGSRSRTSSTSSVESFTSEEGEDTRQGQNTLKLDLQSENTCSLRKSTFGSPKKVLLIFKSQLYDANCGV